ncbi:hypothetical protein KQH60_11370 [Mycetohabitans sp. B8]|nr:hypothetical protein [Mycetohabitans sp. B8]MCG1043100.1 hypothetical protein [Mycetohabitans sp. B8]
MVHHYPPFCGRPIYEPALHGLFLVTAVQEPTLLKWGAFSRDHAML